MVAAAFVAIALATAVASPAPLREIGHVRATTPFCAALQQHFDGAVRPMLAADERIGAIGFTLGTIEGHFHALAPELLIADDRIHLLHFVTDLQQSILEATGELDALRSSSALATDPEAAAQTRDVSVSLGVALAKQRQLAIDSLGIVRAMNDLALGNNLTQIEARGPAPQVAIGPPYPRNYDVFTATTPANGRDVRQYLKWQHQTDRIADAEAAAAKTADFLAERCR